MLRKLAIYLSCSKPLKAFVVGHKSDGRKIIKFANNSCDIYNYDGLFSNESIEIPCGQCIGCRLQYSRQWADRCIMELNYHRSAYFITLTYSDEFINGENDVRRYYVDEETGEAKVSLSLCKRHLQLFFKRLRKQFSKCDIRYYACGEYGDQTLRPHYHLIVFGLELDDLRFYKLSGLKDVYFNSESLDKVWSKDGKSIGYAVVGKVTWETCAYTARYVLKKAKGMTAKKYEQFNMEPEFVLMSRKPGIGRLYYDEYKDDMFEYGSMYLSSDKGSIKVGIPRYFKDRYKLDNPDGYEEYYNRQVVKAKDCINAKLALTDLELEELRDVEEQALIMRTKALKREM